MPCLLLVSRLQEIIADQTPLATSWLPLLGMKEKSSFHGGKGALNSWLVSRKVLGQHCTRLVTALSYTVARWPAGGNDTFK